MHSRIRWGEFGLPWYVNTGWSTECGCPLFSNLSHTRQEKSPLELGLLVSPRCLSLGQCILDLGGGGTFLEMLGLWQMPRSVSSELQESFTAATQPSSQKFGCPGKQMDHPCVNPESTWIGEGLWQPGPELPSCLREQQEPISYCCIPQQSSSCERLCGRRDRPSFFRTVRVQVVGAVG